MERQDMNQISADHEKLRNVLISKLGLPTDRFQRDNQIAEAVEALVLNKRSSVKDSTSLKQIKKLLNVRPDQGFNAIFDCVKALTEERDEALQLREAYNSNVKDWRELCGYFNLPVSTLSDVLSEIDTIRKERDALRDRPDATQPQLSEIRYVLHGDIQPCSVLYSDDTTTLLRLDEGDVMCETDTIEWSDSVTYRCQELLKSCGVGRPVDILAQLVRDERILLNDNGDDELPRPAVVIPTPPVVPATPTCGNPYVHNNFAYLEDAMRAAGWTTEDLVQNGYGYYQLVPMQRSEER